ncbi:CidA/LrgA family protein [Neobacillus terrae]|uniref:CidA/LrgA family protein n=1 Tax=Neobacillus terrae TaxID=3034837 RepID=UPI001FB19C0D|nr:CidA/LrgA family protein [Neobacillus terrae]
MKKILIIIIQILFLHIFLFMGYGVKHVLPIPIPASMIGLIFLFLGLKFKMVKLEWVEQGGNWLLAELLLFFIPSAVGIVNYHEIFSIQGGETVLLIAFSTVIVIGVTAYVAEKILNRKRSNA